LELTAAPGKQASQRASPGTRMDREDEVTTDTFLAGLLLSMAGVRLAIPHARTDSQPLLT